MHHRHRQTGGKFGSNANDFEKVNEEKSEVPGTGGEGSGVEEERRRVKEEGGRSQEQSPKRITILLLAGNDSIGSVTFVPV